VCREDKALDTVGQIIFMRANIFEPNNFGDIVLVSDLAHIPRISYVSRHVLGDEFNILYSGVDIQYTPGTNGKRSIKLTNVS
jgi:hypothetical protein